MNRHVTREHKLNSNDGLCMLYSRDQDMYFLCLSFQGGRHVTHVDAVCRLQTMQYLANTTHANVLILYRSKHDFVPV